jgi:hypothetical protein
MKTTSIVDYVKPVAFLKQAVQATTVKAIRLLVSQLPIVDENTYAFDTGNPSSGWVEGKFHWIPLGEDRGNAGRIKLASRPEGPIAERTINGMEALIELMRRLELLQNPNAPMPQSPRNAVARYFSLPPLDQIPKMQTNIQGIKPQKYARELAKRLRVRVTYDKGEKEFAVFIEDDGIGQAPARMHETLLSLGSSDKGDKLYLIGLFGQGGSSTYAASEYSWCVSRRAAQLLDGQSDGVGWTVVRQIFPKNRRDPFYAYLAASPTGEVPTLPPEAGEAIELKNGSRFAHLGYNFAGGGSAVTKGLYQTLNHILFNPVLPFDLDVGGTLATIYGNGYSHTTCAQAPAAKPVHQPRNLDLLSRALPQSPQPPSLPGMLVVANSDQRKRQAEKPVHRRSTSNEPMQTLLLVGRSRFQGRPRRACPGCRKILLHRLVDLLTKMARAFLCGHEFASGDRQHALRDMAVMSPPALPVTMP